jgi:hypothetical protein
MKTAMHAAAPAARPRRPRQNPRRPRAPHSAKASARSPLQRAKQCPDVLPHGRGLRAASTARHASEMGDEVHVYFFDLARQKRSALMSALPPRQHGSP